MECQTSRQTTFPPACRARITELHRDAAALHDLGLLAAFESEAKPFEVDSANVAERVALENGLAPDIAKLVWNAAAMHDMRWAVVEKQNPTVELVAAGAGKFLPEGLPEDRPSVAEDEISFD